MTRRKRVKMAMPTHQDISQIIEKLKALRRRKSDFWKTEAKKAEAVGDRFKNAAGRELKVRAENTERLKQAAREAVPEICKAVTAIRLLRHRWPDNIQTLINEIDLLLCPYDKFLRVNGSWGADEQKKIEAALKSTEPELNDLDEVIYELKKVKYKMEVEPKRKVSQQPLKAGRKNRSRGKSGRKTVCRTAPRKQASRGVSKPKAKPARDQVFICYSRKDKRWHNDLQSHLVPFVRNRTVTAWSDEQIAPGAEWFAEIKKALARTKVGVLLVTPDFLASDFIYRHELTPLLKEAKKGNVRIIWLPVRTCSFKETPLERDQAALDPAKPLAKMRKPDRDKAWVEICEEIKKAFGP